MDRIERLSESIRFRTVAGKWEEFLKFHEFLERSFPLIHSKLKVHRINQYALLYEWDVGAEESLLFLAHMDVVPAEEEGWIHPPFSGKISDGYVWGRGALDDKSSLMALMEAVEGLLEQNFTPKHNLLLAFGFDEETKGYMGAKKLAEHLENRKIRIKAILDEGSAIVESVFPGVYKPLALIGIAEKGFASFDLVAKGPGGHSSTPYRNAPIERMAKAITRISEYNSKPILIGAVEDFLKTLGHFTTFPLNVVLKHPRFFLPLIDLFFSKSPTASAMLRTTMCVTMLNAGVADNVIPEQVTATVNCRIVPGETAKEVFERIRKIVEDLDVEVVRSEKWEVSDPVEESNTKTDFYQKLVETIGKVFPDAAVSTFLTIGGTDSRHYKRLCRDIYRFSPIKMTKNDLETVHGRNERISTQAYERMCDFYTNLMRKL